jgi:AhpC/TSA family
MAMNGMEQARQGLQVLMRKTRRMTAVILACVGLAGAIEAQSALDLEGRSVNPLVAAAGKVLVLVFVRRDCPVSGRYAPVIQHIGAEHEQDATFWLVFPDKTDSPDAIRKYVADYRYQLPALRDPNHTLVKSAHVQITPEVAVFDPHRQLVYDGRIDNWYVDVTRLRNAPTTHELEEAIRAALDGKPVRNREVRGVGCYISDIE